MREQERLVTLRRELRRQGLWGHRADRLLEVWSDHVRDAAADRIATGAPADAAEAEAWQALGEPHNLAAHAARELNAASWAGRHPWLAGLVFPACGCLGVLIAIMLAGLWLRTAAFDESGHLVNWNALLVWEYTFNWLPLLTSALWLAWLARRMPGGWKLFWISAFTLTFCATTWQMVLIPPLHGPGSGVLTVTAHGVPALLGGIVVAPLEPHCLPKNFWRDEVMDLHLWFQLAVLLLPALLYRTGIMVRTTTPDVAAEKQRQSTTS